MREKILCIYRIRSDKTGKLYIGSAMNFHQRIQRHFKLLEENKHHSIKLQNHYNKYGRDDLISEIVEIVSDPTDLIPREQYYIDLCNSAIAGFNIASTAGNCLGVPRSIETRRKISAAQIGKSLTDEHKRNITDALQGHPVSDEIRKKISASNFGKPKAELHKQNMSIAAKNRLPITEETRQKLSLISKNRIRTKEWSKKISDSQTKVPVIQLDRDGNIIAEYASVKEAAIITSIYRPSISMAIHGKLKSAGGFIWKKKNPS
jgi:group I intron endonuclease